MNITRTYSWDACTNGTGLICGITESSGEGISFTYTSQGQIQTKTDTIGGQSFVTRYDYNNAGQLIKLAYPNGVAVSYSWQDGVIRSLAVNNGTSTTVVNSAVYRSFGPIESFTDRLGSTRSYAYDNDNRLTGVSDAGGAFNFGFDKRDLITSISQADISSVGYSAMGRLINAVQTDLTSAFTYDTNGNRATATYAGYGSSTYAYASSSNQLLSVTSGSNIRSFKYDGAGNLTQDTK